MNNNNEKIRKALETEEVPEELSPENIKTMLDKKSHTEKRRKISVAGRISAVAAACAVIVGGTIVYKSVNPKNCPDRLVETSENSVKDKESTADEETMKLAKTGSYMTGAESYEQVYKLFKGAYDKQSRRRYTNNIKSADNADGAMILEEAYDEDVYDDIETAEAVNEAVYEDVASADIAYTGNTAENNYSETYNQEENVLEADIAKTDGRNIYYLHNGYDENYNSVPEINVATADNGNFTNYGKIFIKDDVSGCLGDDFKENIYVQDMYLYNGMLAVIGSADGWDSDYNNYKNVCFVTFYTADESPQNLGTYYQEGNYSDVRISPDGYMYLITSYMADFYGIDSYEETESYIPSCSSDGEFKCLPADCILLPEENADINSLCYSVIGSIDLTEKGNFSEVETKALAGYTGEIYCSGDNLYTAFGYDDTEITRIAISQGFISPEASGTVDGRINDQFSMSEYGGYFRIATTKDEYEETYHSYYGDDDKPSLWERIGDGITGNSRGYYSQERTKRDNRVYVLDMDMNIVGSVADFGIDETIKSVKFDGETAYVVTYEQTDPLFAIDLSDPTNPVILDEFKILGYSTYMQEWTDGRLLGFGVSADENGRETGIKLTMFDNSDPYNLKAVATYTLDRNDDENWIYSEAVWERKALLIAPEKNLIAVPVVEEHYSYDDDVFSGTSNTKYMFFSFVDGEFLLNGETGSAENMDKYSYNFNRAVYIGDYVYILKNDEFVSVEMKNFDEVQRIYFENASTFEYIEPETEEVTEPETEEVTEPETEEVTEPDTEEEIIESETEEETTEPETEEIKDKNITAKEQENGQAVIGCEVLKINDGSILCRELNTESEYVISLKDVSDSEDAENLSIGDEVKITFDGDIAETYPMQINHVYKIEITLKSE
ncbi:MAG: beta-propeller domain-containing protein [Ruminococcus sp.]|nr:beta-propeller domain-containing protein [Ruminococcus sp.]